MKTQHRLIFSNMLVIFSTLLMVFGLVQDLPFVLCFEPNGQIELEAATTKGSCADWQVNNIQTADAVKQFVKHCFDVPLSHFAYSKESFKTAASGGNPWVVTWLLYGLIALLPVTWLIQRVQEKTRPWALPPPLPALRPIFIKTTVLLL